MATGTTVIRVEDVSKRFVIRKEKSLKERVVNFGRSQAHKEEFWALRGVDLTIGSGTTVGLIGPNGSGKSTLLKMIGGILQPTSGQVQLRGRLAALLELGSGFHPDLTGRENVFLNASILGLSRVQTEKYFDAIVDFSGIEPFIDTQVKFYSSGMYVRLAFAVAVHVDPDILLVDEVLAVGDEPFQRKCMDRIRSFQAEGRTIVLVTHALNTVAEVCDRAIVLEKGVVQIDDAPGPALQFLRKDFEQVRSEERERERERATVTDRRAARARVADVRLLDGAGAAVTQMNPGEEMDVRIAVASEEPLADPVVGISIQTSSGQVIFGTNNRLLGTRLPDLPVGTSSFTYRLPELMLGEGQYTVHAAVAEASGLEIDRMIDAASFAVNSDGTSVGFVHSVAEITTDGVGADPVGLPAGLRKV